MYLCTIHIPPPRLILPLCLPLSSRIFASLSSQQFKDKAHGPRTLSPSLLPSAKSPYPPASLPNCLYEPNTRNSHPAHWLHFLNPFSHSSSLRMLTTTYPPFHFPIFLHPSTSDPETPTSDQTPRQIGGKTWLYRPHRLSMSRSRNGNQGEKNSWDRLLLPPGLYKLPVFIVSKLSAAALWCQKKLEQ